MDKTFVYSAGFVKEWNRLRLTESDLVQLEQLLGRAAESAPVIQGAGGLRKIRFAPSSMHTGKSGATRVGFAYFKTKAAIIVVAIFAKNEVSNFTAAQKAEIAKWLTLIERTFR